MKINVINNTQYHVNTIKRNSNIAFGHYLDDKKECNKSKLSSLEFSISRVDLRMHSEDYNFNRESSSLDSQIYSAESALEETEERISKLRDRVKDKEAYIDNLSNKGTFLQRNAEKNLEIIKQLEAEKLNTIQNLKNSNAEFQNFLNEQFNIEKEKFESNFQKSSEEIKNGLKNSLIQKVVNPIIESIEEKNKRIPSSVYIESFSGTSESIFTWLFKKTDSNFAKINATQYADKNKVISLLKKVSLLAYRSYEESGKRTFTLLSGMENILEEIKDKTTLQELLSNAEQMYHNIIITISKTPYSKISKHVKFSEKLKVESNFAKDRIVGKDNFIDFIVKNKTNGEDLLYKVVVKRG